MHIVFERENPYVWQAKRCLKYEWKRAENKLGRFSPLVIPEEFHWHSSKEWKTYNFNDGSYGGLPKTLRVLYDAHEKTIKGLLEEAN